MKVSGKDKHKMKGMYDILTVLRGKNADKLGAEASESILRMISNLCALEEENRSIIGGDEAILALLLRIAQKYKSNPFVSKQALSAFRYIAEDNTGKEILGERGGIEVVMNIANEHVNNFAVMEQGVGAISNLTEDNEDNANKLVEFGAHTFTVNAMNQHGQNSTDVTSSGFDAMKNLAISPENIEEIQSSGGLEGIVHAIWEHLHDEGVTSAGYETLDRLASRTSVRERLGGVLSERKDVSEGLLQMEDNSSTSLTASNLTTIIKKDRNRGGNNIPPPPPINAIRRNQSQDTLHSFIDRQEILSGHIGAITALIQLDNGKLVSSANDRFLKVWNTVSSESSLKTLRGHTDVINCVIQLKSGVIASCGNDNTIRLWNVDTGVCTATFKGHTRWVMTIIQLRDGRLVSGSDDKTIKIWNVNTGYCVNTLRGHMKWVKCLLELDDGYLVSGTGSKGPVNCIIQLSDGRVASASTAGFIRFWDYIYSGSSINSFAISKTAINTCIQLRDGRIVAGTSDGSITCWDAETGNCVNHLNHIHQRVINVIIQLKDDRLATGSGDTSIHILDLDSLQ